MVSLQPLNFNLGRDIKLGSHNIPESVNIKIQCSKTKITGVIANWEDENLEIIPEFPKMINQKKTLLLTLLNYISTHKLNISLVQTHADTLQNTLNNIVLVLGSYIVFEHLLINDKFCKTYKNPFAVYTGNFEVIILQLKYFCKLSPDFSFKVIYKTLINLKLFEKQEWNSWIFLKNILTNLYTIYEWHKPEIFEIAKNNKDSYIKFAEYTGNYIQHYYNEIYRYKNQFLSMKNILQTYDINNKRSHEIKDVLLKIASLESKEGYNEAPINYPNHYQLELYDKFSEALEYEKSAEIQRIRENSDSKGISIHISKIELNYENKKIELQGIIKTIIFRFGKIFNLEIPNADLKIKITAITQNLRNKLWYFQNEVGASYSTTFVNLSNINNVLNKILEHMQPLIQNPGIPFENIISKINVYYEELNTKILDLQNVDLSALDQILASTLNLKSYTYLVPELPSTLDINLDFELLIINEIQLSSLKHRISEICEHLESINIGVPSVIKILEEIFSFQYTFIENKKEEYKEIVEVVKIEEIEAPIQTEPTLSDLYYLIEGLSLQIKNLESRIDLLHK